MAQQRYYMSCPDCRTRMVRTGKKVKEYRSLYETWVYKREYSCSGCGLVIGYSGSRNLFYSEV